MLTLEKDNLAEILQNHPRVMVQFGATWCGNCRMIKPKFKKLAEERPDITFVYIDAEHYPDSRKFAQVDNLPTFAFFTDGKLIDQKQGNKIDLVKELIHANASH